MRSSRQLIPKELSLRNFRRLLTEPGHPEFLRWLFNSVWLEQSQPSCRSSCHRSVHSRLVACALRAVVLRCSCFCWCRCFRTCWPSSRCSCSWCSERSFSPAIGIGTDLGLILIYLGGSMGVNTWLMKGFFDTMPIDLDEAAKIDGATHA